MSVPRRARCGTYAYALIEASARPALAAAPAGPPGTGPARLLDVSPGIWLLVCDARSGFDQDAVERGLRDPVWVSECAVGHELVVEHAVALGTVAPFKMLTLFDGDASAVAGVRRARSDWSAALRRVAGREEWGVRLEAVERPRRTAKRQAHAAGGLGTRFLRARQLQASARRSASANAARTADDVLRRLARGARAVWRAARPGRGPLDAALLVDVRRRESLRAAAAREARRAARAGLRLSVSGPWPCYHFVREGQ